MTSPTDREQTSEPMVRHLINGAIATNRRLHIQYLDSARLVEPLALNGDLLTARIVNDDDLDDDLLNEEETGSGRIRQWRVEFIREAVIMPERRLGRPPRRTEPYQKLTMELPAALVAQLDDWLERHSGPRNEFVAAAIREKLARADPADPADPQERGELRSPCG